MASGMKNVVLLYCRADNANYGDVYLLKRWIDRYRQDRPDLRLLAVMDAPRMQALFADEPAVLVNGYLTQLVAAPAARDAPSPTPEEAARAGAAAADRLLERDPDWRRLLGRVAWVHVCGGGYLNGMAPRSHRDVGVLSRLAERLGVPLYGTGLGLMPFGPASEAKAELFSRFTFVESRDSEGVAELRALGAATEVIEGLDDSFVLPVQDDVDETPGRARLVLNFQKDMRSPALAQRDLERVVHAVQQLADEHGDALDIEYLSFFDRNDLGPGEAIQRAVPRTRLRRCADLLHSGLPIRPGDLCLATRFHFHLLAARLGGRGVYLTGRGRFYAVKHASVARLGSGWINGDGPRPLAPMLRGAAAPAIDEAGLAARKAALVQRIFATPS